MPFRKNQLPCRLYFIDQGPLGSADKAYKDSYNVLTDDQKSCILKQEGENMPTIQFRTDDQTKTASTDLFNQLGMTMSEAINLFLRQSIMHGGLPFTLTVPKGERVPHSNGSQFLDDVSLIDALRRYKAVNNTMDFDIAKAESFLQVLRQLKILENLRITLYEQAVKARLVFKEQEYVIDYHFEEPDSVFILSRKAGKLQIKDCTLAEIPQTLELFS
jgi:addiction module RelB/DinJ family antitoxin